MTTIHRVVGPPGCGKTSWLSRQCKRAVEKYGENAALVVSLTKAAAREAGGRDTGLSSRMIGTLHSHCYRALGMPPVAEESKKLKTWNEEYPELSLSYDGMTEWGDISAPASTAGDAFLSRMNILRHRMVPRSDSRWGDDLRNFAEAWDDFKQQTGGVDFCDMIERATHDVPIPPGNPAAIFADEAQDFSALELDLLRRWGVHVEHLTLVYDPAQSLYAWRGADQEMASAEPSIVLSQSYRVPRLVQELAMSVIRNSSTYREAEYKPRQEDGSVERVSWNLRSPEEWVEGLDDPFDGPTMVVASCSYMLDSLVAEMRRRGIAYHNPFSPARWNPLAIGGKGRFTAVDRLLAFLSKGEGVTEDSTVMLAKSLKVSAMRSGKAMKEEDDTAESGVDLSWRSVFSDEALSAMEAKDLEWYVSHLKSGHAKSSEYPIAVYRRWENETTLRQVASADRPTPGGVVVGTIHSVKGGEAERVVVFPDMSPKGMKSLGTGGWLHEDSVWRMFYVATTRAKSSLIIGEAMRPNLSCPL